MTAPVVALFVDAKGPYPSLADDWYDKHDDARTYHGKCAVVAHPPCQLWTNLAALNYKRYGGEHNRPGNDGGCFEHALRLVRRNGGVLEHPALSHAWPRYGLLRPRGFGWKQMGEREWVAELWQSAYGHAALKRTWLFYSGEQPWDARWWRANATAQIGWFERVLPTLGRRAACLTPLPFAKYLVYLAATSSGARTKTRALK